VADPVATLGTVVVGLTAIPAGIAAIRSTQTQRAVAPNGQTVTQLLHRIVEFEEYQHTRNHDVLAAATVEVLLLYELGRSLGAELPELSVVREFSDWLVTRDHPDPTTPPEEP